MLLHDARILRKICEEIVFLENLLDGLSREEFASDEVVKRAASMASINVGELAKRLSDAFFEEHPGSELRMAARTRDAYAHGYFSLSFDRVYNTAKEDYPRLRQWVESVLPDDADSEVGNAE